MGNQKVTHIHMKKQEVEVTCQKPESQSDDGVDSDEGFVFFGDHDSDNRAKQQSGGRLPRDW
jgi:hypothetical protein